MNKLWGSSLKDYIIRLVLPTHDGFDYFSTMLTQTLIELRHRILGCYTISFPLKLKIL